jgi:hypothetical protein
MNFASLVHIVYWYVQLNWLYYELSYILRAINLFYLPQGYNNIIPSVVRLESEAKQ